MPVIPKSKTSETVYVAQWDHKHGQDISIHTTEDGARKQLAAWARGALEDWEDDSYKDVNDEDLLNNWSEITGETEFFSVEDHLLYNASVWGKVSGKSIK